MRLLTRYILREHLLPFFYALLIIIFLLFTNFLVRAIDKLLGKGLPWRIIVEYLWLNIAWILALAAPMAVLVATFMAFGKFSEDNEITALRASGVSFTRILWPALAFGFTIASILTYFNNAVLPHMNYKAKTLSRDIYRKRPDLNIEPGYFIDDLPQYSLIVKGKKGNRYQDVKIYSKDNTTTQTSIHAKEGDFTTYEDAIILTLYNGEIHELDTRNFENYRRIKFEKHRILVPADNLMLKRRDSGSRNDREMTISMMNEKIAHYEEKKQNLLEKMNKQLKDQFSISKFPFTNFANTMVMLDQVKDSLKSDTTLTNNELIRKERSLNSMTNRIKANFQILEGYQKSINRYGVEIHKKFSIPVACIVFILVGAPLGVMARKGGFITSISFSFSFFLIYYIFLIGGEELADRNYTIPVVAMWAPNLLLGIIGIILSIQTSRQQRSLRIPLLSRVKKKKPVTSIN